MDSIFLYIIFAFKLKKYKVMKGFVDKINFFDTLIKKFVNEISEEVYLDFKNQYGYDPREDGDQLILDDWEIDEDLVVFKFREISPHDRPYRNKMAYRLENFKLFSE